MNTEITAQIIEFKLEQLDEIYNYDRNLQEMSEISTSTKGKLYLSYYMAPYFRQKYEINAIFTMNNETGLFQDVKQYLIDIEDKSSVYHQNKMLKIIQDHVDLIHQHLENGDNVLIHCYGGVSRSPTLVASYLMKYQKMKALDSIIYLKNTRKCIYPNISFLAALLDYEKIISNENAEEIPVREI